MKFVILTAMALCSVAGPKLAQGEADWLTFTLDNDAMVDTDGGYTNGLFFSWYDTNLNNKSKPGTLARAMLWSLPDVAGEPIAELSSYTIGQAIMTPSDTKTEDPPEDDLPYGGLLFYSNSFIRAYPTYADKISVVVGVTGEMSFAEETQKFAHEINDSNEPNGWDTQLEDEIVFSLGRSRAWRAWVFDSGSSEILTGVDAQLGTIQSSVGVSTMYRYGTDLQRTYATALLSDNKTANPVGAVGGWFWFIEARASYLANWIFFNGNTYKDSHTYDCKEETVSVSTGFAYSWKDFSITFAISDLNTLVDNDEDKLDELTQYGTLTFTWRGH